MSVYDAFTFSKGTVNFYNEDEAKKIYSEGKIVIINPKIIATHQYIKSGIEVADNGLIEFLDNINIVVGSGYDYLKGHFWDELDNCNKSHTN